MFFILNRTNYSRWVPIYFEDCCNLEAKFPILHQSFCDGNFVVHHTNRRNCGMPIDQALKKEYHKKAKGPGGIIGKTKKEESVAKWNLIKHEKCAFTKFLDDISGLSWSDMYSLHHEFSKTTTKNDHKDVEEMKEFLSTKFDIMRPGKMSNLITRIELSHDTAHC